jgi:tripartite-type tricarboxylate transporter receptor subunit TctC
MVGAAIALGGSQQAARAQAYPSRPVHIIVGFAPGGFSDITARLIAPWLSERLGQQFVVENRPGGSGNIATAVVARATADGYTLLQAGDSNAFNATLYDKLSFDFIGDFVPVASIDRAPFVMVVNPSSPAKTVAEFIAYAKANVGKINMGASGVGGPTQLYGELFKAMTGVDMIAVQYRGVGVALPDLIGGRLDVIFAPVASAVGQIKAGRLRPLGVTSAMRVAALPELPTISETVPGYEASGWTGFCAPAHTPPEIVATLNQHVNAALADTAFKAKLAELGLEPYASAPDEFGRFIADATQKWGKVIRTAGIKAE